MRRRIVKGFSLVELMIALALGSIVISGVVQLFVANSDTHNLLVGQSRMQESARFALEFIGREVRQSGYRGCFSRGDALHTVINPPTAIPYEFDIRFGIQGFEATNTTGTWSPALTVLPNTGTAASVYETTYAPFYGRGNGIDITGVANGTDAVTFRHMSKIDARLGGFNDPGTGVLVMPRSAMPTSSEEVVIGVDPGWSEFDKDHLVMIHDCEKATIFRVTSDNGWARNADGSPGPAPGSPGDHTADLTVGHDTVNIDARRNNEINLADINTFGLDASVSAIESHTFYIAPSVGINNDGKNQLSLWRKSTLAAPIELVEGVENLQFLYGEDTDSDDIPNKYQRADEVTDWAAVVTIRVTVIVNSIDNVGSTSVPILSCGDRCIDGEVYDGLIRRAFTQTMHIRNRG